MSTEGLFYVDDANQGGCGGEDNINNNNNNNFIPITQVAPEEEESESVDEEEEDHQEAANEATGGNMNNNNGNDDDGEENNNNEATNNNNTNREESGGDDQNPAAGGGGGGDDDPDDGGDDDEDDDDENEDGEDGDDDEEEEEEEEEEGSDDENTSGPPKKVVSKLSASARKKSTNSTKKTNTSKNNDKRTTSSSTGAKLKRNETQYIDRGGVVKKYGGTTKQGRMLDRDNNFRRQSVGGDRKSPHDMRQPYLDAIEMKSASSNNAMEDITEDNTGENTGREEGEAPEAMPFTPTSDEAQYLLKGASSFIRDEDFFEGAVWWEMLMPLLRNITDDWAEDRQQSIISLLSSNRQEFAKMWKDMMRKVENNKKVPKNAKIKKTKKKKASPPVAAATAVRSSESASIPSASTTRRSDVASIPPRGAPVQQNNAHLYRHPNNGASYQWGYQQPWAMHNPHNPPPPPQFWYPHPSHTNQVIDMTGGNVMSSATTQGTSAQLGNDDKKPAAKRKPGTREGDTTSKKKKAKTTTSEQKKKAEKPTPQQQKQDEAAEKKKRSVSKKGRKKQNQQQQILKGRLASKLIRTNRGTMDSDSDMSSGHEETTLSSRTRNTPSINMNNQGYPRQLMSQDTVLGQEVGFAFDTFYQCDQPNLLVASSRQRGVGNKKVFDGVNFISQEQDSGQDHDWEFTTTAALRDSAKAEVMRNKNKHGLPDPNILPRFRDAPVQETSVFSPNPAHFSTMMQLSWGVDHYPPGGVNEKGGHVVNPKVPRSAVLTNIESKERGQNCSEHKRGCGHQLEAGCFVFLGGDVQYCGSGVSEIITHALVPGQGKGCCVGRTRCLSHQVPSFVHRLAMVGYVSSHHVNNEGSELHKNLGGYAHLTFLDFDNGRFNPSGYRPFLCRHLPTEANLTNEDDDEEEDDEDESQPQTLQMSIPNMAEVWEIDEDVLRVMHSSCGEDIDLLMKKVDAYHGDIRELSNTFEIDKEHAEIYYNMHGQDYQKAKQDLDDVMANLFKCDICYENYHVRAKCGWVCPYCNRDSLCQDCLGKIQDCSKCHYCSSLFTNEQRRLYRQFKRFGHNPTVMRVILEQRRQNSGMR